MAKRGNGKAGRARRRGKGAPRPQERAAEPTRTWAAVLLAALAAMIGGVLAVLEGVKEIAGRFP